MQYLRGYQADNDTPHAAAALTAFQLGFEGAGRGRRPLRLARLARLMIWRVGGLRLLRHEVVRPGEGVTAQMLIASLVFAVIGVMGLLIDAKVPVDEDEPEPVT